MLPDPWPTAQSREALAAGWAAENGLDLETGGAGALRAGACGRIAPPPDSAAGSLAPQRPLAAEAAAPALVSPGHPRLDVWARLPQPCVPACAPPAGPIS